MSCHETWVYNACGSRLMEYINLHCIELSFLDLTCRCHEQQPCFIFRHNDGRIVVDLITDRARAPMPWQCRWRSLSTTTDHIKVVRVICDTNDVFGARELRISTTGNVTCVPVCSWSVLVYFRALEVFIFCRSVVWLIRDSHSARP
jgi:hypothetical protein